MSSKKRSAYAKEKAAFLASATGGADMFEREARRLDDLNERRDKARYERACTSKKRYATKLDAQEAIELCAEHGTFGLRCYRCSYCHGWHLSSRQA